MNDQLQKLLSDIQEKTDNKFSGLSSIIQDIGDGVTELYDEVYLTQGEVEGIKKVIETTNYQEKIDELSKQIADIQIIKGDKGDKGDNGKDGKNGKDGRDGKDGLNGLNGRDGIDGINGKDGSPDTPEQIAEKINTLENAIDIKALKDFPKIEDTTEIKRQVDTIGNQVLRLLSKKTETPVIDLSGYVPTSRTITINGTTQDLSADRSWTISTFTLPSLTSGSILFSDGTTIAQDNANLFWDNTNKRLGIGTKTPTRPLEIKSSDSNSIVARIENMSGAEFVWGISGGGYGLVSNVGTGDFVIRMTGDDSKFRFKASGRFGIGVVNPTATLHIKGGSATAGTAPLKLTAGTNLTTPENGAFEFDGTNLYFTVGGVRKTVSLV